MVQVAIKPLVHTGVDIPVFVALRDKRLKSYKASILSLIQTNVCNGPVYFNCVPHFSVSLTDPLFLSSLMLDIHLQGDEFEKFTEQVAVIYRIYFKLLNSHLTPNFKLKGSKTQEEIVLLQIEADHSKTFVPKRLKWNEITIPNEFRIEAPQVPRNIEQTEIHDIIEEQEGTILIRFNSLREKSFEGSSSFNYSPSEVSMHSNFESHVYHNINV